MMEDGVLDAAPHKQRRGPRGAAALSRRRRRADARQRFTCRPRPSTPRRRVPGRAGTSSRGWARRVFRSTPTSAPTPCARRRASARVKLKTSPVKLEPVKPAPPKLEFVSRKRGQRPAFAPREQPLTPPPPKHAEEEAGGAGAMTALLHIRTAENFIIGWIRRTTPAPATRGLLPSPTSSRRRTRRGTCSRECSTTRPTSTGGGTPPNVRRSRNEFRQ